MWVFNREGFFSVVQNQEADNQVMVRARFAQDLENLKKKLSSVGAFSIPTIKTPKADYPFRIILNKTEWAEYLRKSALDIDYPNFKSSLKDQKRHDIYLQVWGVMRRAAESITKKKGKKRQGQDSYFFDESGVYEGKRDGYLWGQGSHD